MTTAEPTPSRRRLDELPGPMRLAVGCFLGGILAFYGLAQVKVIGAVGGGTKIPGPAEILVRYHGDPTRSKVHQVLDPALPETDPRRMYGWLGVDEPERVLNRTTVLSWVERGAPEREWSLVDSTFQKCAGCHGRAAEGTGTRRDLPLETYADVIGIAKGDGGMSIGELETTSHNHLFGFLVASLLVSLIFGSSRWRGRLVTLLIVGAFGGALVDVAAWWGARWFGSPFQYLVLLGGAAFGISVATMAVLSLDEIALRGRLARIVEPLLRRLGLGHREGA